MESVAEVFDQVRSDLASSESSLPFAQLLAYTAGICMLHLDVIYYALVN